MEAGSTGREGREGPGGVGADNGFARGDVGVVESGSTGRMGETGGGQSMWGMDTVPPPSTHCPHNHLHSS